MATLTQQPKKEIEIIKKEIRILRSFIFSLVVEDKEGKYKTSFIKNILKASQEKPTFIFKNATSFRSLLLK